MNSPRKRFGQHFLQDQAVIARIIASLDPKPGEHLIEIGPGQGALTLPILKKIPALEVIELDRDVIPDLEERAKHLGQLVIYSADVLKFNFFDIKKDARLLRIFGNLPYNISTPLIFHLLDHAPLIADMLFMLQKEVAERLAAKANTPHYGRLSVMVQYHCEVELLFGVPATAFYPAPQVRSSIVRLVPHRHYPCCAKSSALFSEVVKQAFGQRRKTLRNSLKHIITDDVWAGLSIRSDLRPENLQVSDFVEISNALFLSASQA